MNRRVYTNISESRSGDPDASFSETGQLVIYPTGVGGSCLVMEPDTWDNLVAAVSLLRAVERNRQ